MEIVSGKARGVVLSSPDCDSEETRPTSVRARKAFFDSLGNVEGLVFADLFAGSGAMGLEAASRGASAVIFVEGARASIQNIERNCAKVSRTGVVCRFTTLHLTLPGGCTKLKAVASRPKVIFADPPYPESAALFAALTVDANFTEWASDAVLYWELPETKHDFRPPPAPWKLENVRMLGPVRFMVLAVKK